MMVDVYRTFAAPLEHETLWPWHGTLMRERRWLAVIGGYRQHQEPMQVVSGPDYKRRVHYEAPPSHMMMIEMDRFIGWYERTREMPALTRAGVAHFYFECIHPFEDGNGRIGRALAEKALAADGKRIRGTNRNAMRYETATLVEHRTGVPVASLNFHDRNGELEAVGALLEVVPSSGAVITLNALHTTRDTTVSIVERRAAWRRLSSDRQGELFRDLRGTRYHALGTGHRMLL